MENITLENWMVTPKMKARQLQRQRFISTVRVSALIIAFVSAFLLAGLADTAYLKMIGSIN